MYAACFRFEHAAFFVMDNQIRRAIPDDVPAIHGLMREFALYEGLLDSLTVTEEILREVLFGESAFVEALVAEVDGSLGGYAMFYPHFSSFRGQAGYYLEDIYVDSGFRGRRFGERMLREVARLARERGFVRLDFQVLEWNTSAIEFYKSLGAELYDEDRHFKFTAGAFERLAAL